ncbi:MAG: hypothetical protein JSS27_09330 [Planctomycetes bacterium]|nr:hypothetical protein [Planctomycetota bacterium]
MTREQNVPDALSRQLAPVLDRLYDGWCDFDQLDDDQMRMWALLRRLSRRANRKIIKAAKPYQKKSV